LFLVVARRSSRALTNEIKLCLKKIGDRERLQIDWSLLQPRKPRELRDLLKTGRASDFVGVMGYKDPSTGEAIGDAWMSLYWLYNLLEDRFKDYHLARAKNALTSIDLASLSGV
jgi:hypothetical protein